MQDQSSMATPSSQGILYIVATPIGNLKDITYRAIETLHSVDEILCEDTRHSMRLLTQHQISKPLISINNHNESQRKEFIMDKLKKGLCLALISDAGTPLISDPGYLLVKAARAQGIRIVPIPGASAIITALSACGLPTNHFSFYGFLHANSSKRQAQIQTLKHEQNTLILYESPHRLMGLLQDILQIMGKERQVVVAKELTKTFETFASGPISTIIDYFLEDDKRQKGEFVIIIEGDKPKEVTETTIKDYLLTLLAEGLSTKQAAKITTKLLNCKKNQAYNLALKLQER